MAKRFIDTEIFADEWFSELSKDGKLFFIYFTTNCDHAGVLRLNKKLAEFQTGIKNIETVTQELCNCLVTVKEGLYFMPKFLRFQYPGFPRSNVKQQEGAVKILESLGVDYLNSLVTVTKDLPESYVSDSDSVDDKKGKNHFSKPSIDDVKTYCANRGNSVNAETFIDHYESNGWMVGRNKMKNWKAAVRTWEKNNFDSTKPKGNTGTYVIPTDAN